MGGGEVYKELSKKFRELYPSVIRAFQLIPLMYNRLTLIDGLSHKRALKKISDDHKDLTGFSGRNIRRYLPTGNPSVPKRIRTPRPKIGLTGISQGKLFGTANEPKQKENILSAPFGSVTSLGVTTVK